MQVLPPHWAVQIAQAQQTGTDQAMQIAVTAAAYSSGSSGSAEMAAHSYKVNAKGEPLEAALLVDLAHPNVVRTLGVTVVKVCSFMACI